MTMKIVCCKYAKNASPSSLIQNPISLVLLNSFLELKISIVSPHWGDSFVGGATSVCVCAVKRGFMGKLGQRATHIDAARHRICNARWRRLERDGDETQDDTRNATRGGECRGCQVESASLSCRRVSLHFAET